MNRLPICLLLATAFPLTAWAEESPKPDTWLCQGQYQTAPGEPLKTQNRMLVLDPATSKVTMKVGNAEYQGKYTITGQNLEVSLQVPGIGDETLVEEVVLVRMKGRLSSVVKAQDGKPVGQFRGGCVAGSPRP